jgi:tetratricopeptide (TPR) repeat protein
MALFGWIPIVLMMFAVLRPQRAAAVAVVGAWLLLPPIIIPIAHLPDYSKSTAATLGILLATAIFCPHRILGFRTRWFDLPMVGWFLSPIASSLDNGLGLYDGLSGSLTAIVDWGFPYLIGRLYFSDCEGLSELTLAMIVGGLAYVPACIFEARMSDKLLPAIYGVGGIAVWRPKVFFGTALECGLWMTAAALTAWWLWRCGSLRRVGRIRFGGGFLAMLIGTVFLCQTKAALVLLVGGVFVLWVSTRFRTRLLLGALALFGPIYAGVRIPNLWSGQQAVELARHVFNDARATSLKYRLDNEELLIAKALERPIFGWGGWSRFSVYGVRDEAGVFHPEPENPDHAVPYDGMWLLTFGYRGYVGLILWYLILQLPTILFVRHFPVKLWAHPRVAAASLGATLLGLYVIDCTLNGFLNIIYVSLAGGLIGLRPEHLGLGLRSHQAGALDRGIGSGRRTESGRPSILRSAAGMIRLAERTWRLGRTFKKEGRLAEAETAWRQALDLLAAATLADPAAVQRRWCDCANDLAWLRLHHSDPALRDPAFAVALARQVVETCPDCGVYWNTLGVAYLRTGAHLSAVAALERSIALGNGTTAFDDVFLAMAHAHLGDWEQARHRLASAMVAMERDYPGHPELARFCDEVQSLLTAGPQGPIAAC